MNVIKEIKKAIMRALYRISGRNIFHTGELLTEEDLSEEQNYQRHKKTKKNDG